MSGYATKVICPDCTRGVHQHDTYPDGTGAGCPKQGITGDIHSECICPIRIPGVARKHCSTCRCYG